MLHHELARALRSSERVLWTGGPRHGVVFRTCDLFLVPFSLLWGGFAIFWEAMAVTSGAPWFFKLWGIPFVLVGLYLIAGRFIADAWRRGSMTYAVTDQRLLTIRSWPTSRVQSTELQGLSHVALEEKADGTGSIDFESPPSRDPRRRWDQWNEDLDGPRWVHVEHVRDVYRTLEAARRNVRES